MILQALTRYYEDLLSRGEIAASGWSPAKISYALCLNGAGDLEQVILTMEEVTKGKKTVLQPQTFSLQSELAPTFFGITLLTFWVWTKKASRNGAGIALLQRRRSTMRCWTVWIPR